MVEDRAGFDPVRPDLQPVALAHPCALGALPIELPIHFREPTGVADGIQTHSNWGHIPAR